MRRVVAISALLELSLVVLGCQALCGPYGATRGNNQDRRRKKPCD